MSEILAQVWPSVPGCALFGSILVRHRLTPGRLSMHRELFLVATAFTDDRGSSGQATECIHFSLTVASRSLDPRSLIDAILSSSYQSRIRAQAVKHLVSRPFLSS